MESITIYPENEKQKSLLQALLEAMHVRFEIGRSGDKTAFTQEEFIAKIDSAIQQAEAGRTRILSKEDQKTLLDCELKH